METLIIEAAVVVALGLSIKPFGDWVKAYFEPRIIDQKIEKTKKLAELEKVRMQTDHLIQTYPDQLKKQTDMASIVADQQIIVQRVALAKATAALPPGTPLEGSNTEDYYVKEVLRSFQKSQAEYVEWASDNQVPRDCIYTKQTLIAYLQHNNIATVGI